MSEEVVDALLTWKNRCAILSPNSCQSAVTSGRQRLSQGK